jgi:DNA-binding LacI/PurR family transcriptional regulator
VEDFRYSIYHDDIDGSRQVTRHLIELGHKRIAYIGNSASGRTTLDRSTGFRQEMKSARLNVPAEYICEASGGGTEDGVSVAKYFSLPERLIVGMLQRYASHWADEGLQESGIRVPEISRSQFDNIVFRLYQPHSPHSISRNDSSERRQPDCCSNCSRHHQVSRLQRTKRLEA